VWHVFYNTYSLTGHPTFKLPFSLMKKIFEKVKPDSRIIIGYSASLFLLLVVYVVTLVANSKLKEKTLWIEHTYQVILSNETLLSKMKDAETGVRGYAITGNDDFLEPYIHSEEAVDSIYNGLKKLTKDNPVQQRRLAELKEVCDKRFRIFAEYIAYMKNGKVDSSYHVNAEQMEAKRTMNTIRRLADFMQKDENKLLAERNKELKSTFASINTISITSLLLTLVLVIIGFVTYTKESKGRQIAMQDIKEYQQQLSSRIEELNTANSQLLQMRSMEKFAATGRIARTIAHEVRNPLTNIDLAASQLKTEMTITDENTTYFFDVIERNSKRINKLISDLLVSTKFAELNVGAVSINSLLDETLMMAKDRIGLQQVVVEKKYDTVQTIHVDVEKMKIAFLNIIINAIEAMEPGKGILSIGTSKQNNNCIITIADNGAGMDDVALTKLFEPYFTSKPNGNGLGLANTQNIIFNHQGVISAASRVGLGTVFTITLAAN
jgi:signal transduction histidine kinase